MAGTIRLTSCRAVCGLTASVVLAVSSAAMAQSGRSATDIDTPELVIEATAGWDGYFDRSTPVPVSFLLHNHSNRIIRGELTLSETLDGPGVSLAEIVLAPVTTQRFSSIQAMPNWYQCYATLRNGEKILWRRELSLSTGNEFNVSHNYALLIDASRGLDLPSGGPVTAGYPENESLVPGEQGKPVRCLSVKPWQVPNHSGPMRPAQAVIFPEGAAAGDLNRAQWRAVATWMCQGGTVFAHAESRDISEQLTKFAPLGSEAPFPSGEFMVRRVGLGAIYEYPQPLFSSAGTEMARLIGETTARMSVNGSYSMRFGQYNTDEVGQSNLNRILVLVFFGVYALFSGVGAFALARAGRRRVATYTVVVVVSASAFAGGLGGYLRSSTGDLNWATVTQAGVGGAVQSGRIDVQSAGGRNKQVAVKGHDPDLQLLERDSMYRYSYRYHKQWLFPCRAFTWQPNLARPADDTYQINVPITPWGIRELQATSFRPDLRRMDFKLDFERAEINRGSGAAPAGLPEVPNGRISLRLVSHLPFDIEEGWLIVGATGFLATENRLVDVYQIRRLPAVRSGATHEETFASEFQWAQHGVDMLRSLDDGWAHAPRIARMGDATAWLIGRIEDSPDLRIDTQRSDFHPRNEFHLFVQEIRPEDMPDPSVILEGIPRPVEERPVDGENSGMRDGAAVR